MARITVERNIAFDDVRNKFYVTLHYGVVDGKQIRKTETFSSKREAQRRLRLFEGEKEKGEVIMPNCCTLGEWLDYWLEDIVLISCAKTTYAGYKYIVNNHIKPELGKIKLQELSKVRLQKYFKQKQSQVDSEGNRKISNNTLRKHHVLLLTALNIAVEDEIIKKNPEEKVKLPKYEKPKIPFYNIDQAMELLIKVDDNYILKPTVNLAIHAGLRRSEIVGLRWSDIDFENNLIQISKARVRAGKEIIVKEPKNATSKRPIYMTDELAEVLREVQEMQVESKELLGNIYKDTDYVVVDQYGNEVNPGYLSTLFGRFIKNNELPNITLHGLRHSTASIMLNSGVPLARIGDILGHANIVTTKSIYGHWEDELHKDVMIEYGKMFNVKRK